MELEEIFAISQQYKQGKYHRDLASTQHPAKHRKCDNDEETEHVLQGPAAPDLCSDVLALIAKHLLFSPLSPTAHDISSFRLTCTSWNQAFCDNKENFVGLQWTEKIHLNVSHPMFGKFSKLLRSALYRNASIESIYDLVTGRADKVTIFTTPAKSFLRVGDDVWLSYDLTTGNLFFYDLTGKCILRHFLSSTGTSFNFSITTDGTVLVHQPWAKDVKLKNLTTWQEYVDVVLTRISTYGGVFQWYIGDMSLINETVRTAVLRWQEVVKSQEEKKKGVEEKI